MNKASFVERTARRARVRYGQDFTYSLLNDLMKDGLIDAGKRAGNNGRQPIYKYDWQAYRRALQIVRMRRGGVIGRDALRVMLFLKGYSAPAHDVRAALQREYRANARSLLKQVRSGYADKVGAVPAKHRASLLRQMGTLDEAFDKAGLELPSMMMVDLFRTAKQDAIESEVTPAERAAIGHLLRSLPLLPSFASPMFSGMLNLAEDGFERSSEVDSVELVIHNSSDDDLEVARFIYRHLTRLGFIASAAFGFSGNLRHAIERVAVSIRDNPNWATLIFVFGLRFILSDPAFAQSLRKAGNFWEKHCPQ